MSRMFLWAQSVGGVIRLAGDRGAPPSQACVTQALAPAPDAAGEVAEALCSETRSVTAHVMVQILYH